MNIRKLRILTAIVIGAAVTTIFGCYPRGPRNVGDLDIVRTSYDPEFSFGGAKTYLMPDSILLVDDPSNEASVNPSGDAFVLARIKQNIETRGYTPFDTATSTIKPDLIVLVSKITTKKAGWTYFPSFPWGGWGYYPGWGRYYPGFGPGWGGYYPGWTPVPYNYTTGSIMIDMGDGQNVDTVQKLMPMVWNAGVNGILSSSNSYNEDRITRGVNQAFSQSPYLQSK